MQRKSVVSAKLEEAEQRNLETDQAWERFQTTGEHLAHEDVKAWLSSWGTAEESPPPERPHVAMERARLVAAVEEGLADVEAGRVHSHGEVARRMRDRFGSGGRPK